jgi:chemotaxis protein methyltransferase CheR
MLTPIASIAAAQTLAQAIVNTIPEPFIVLDGQLRVVVASRSFYEVFKVDAEHTRGSLLYALGDGQWDIPALRLLLETIIPEQTAMDGFEVQHDFPNVGPRTMLLNARQVIYDDSSESTILLAFNDVTVRRAIEREKAALLRETEDLLRQKHILFQEMQHRVANSLQIIASILLLKARAVTSEETRSHLQDAHQRVMSVAAVQHHLHATDGIDRIEVGSYLEKLCGSLASSMVGDSRPIVIKVVATPGDIDSGEAVSIGLIVTELLINAIKYAFPTDKAGAEIIVTHEVQDKDWKLTVADNGVGRQGEQAVSANSGLGTAVVKALAEQLGASVEHFSDSTGMRISITRATFTSQLPLAG